MNTEPLKPCPFCGSTDIAPTLIGNQRIAVECGRCEARGPFAIRALGDETDSDYATQRWNMRASVMKEHRHGRD